uniref:Helicase ATP-binding domain-containing protein n=1 Tax=Strongyloides stercoralis TaxID=6248 RepID=A0A913HPH0_STRER
MICIKTISSADNHHHMLFSKSDIDYGNYFKGSPKYKIESFEIDEFQKISHLCLDRNENVILAAHTGSGKTVAATYSIRLALENKTRVFYTGPIKSLVYQKYKEFQKKFPNKVGIITGDCVIRPNKPIIVMTTEVLANITLNNFKKLRDVSHIIFDELQFMGNPKRGKNWEKAIINSPKDINFLFLTTIAENLKTIALWICDLKMAPCHLIKTKKSLIEREYLLYPCIENNFNLLKENDKKFNDEIFYNVKKKCSLEDIDTNHISNVLKKLLLKKCYPIFFYCNTRIDCKKFSLKFKNSNFLYEEEKQEIQKKINLFITKYRQYKIIIEEMNKYKVLLLNGIALHHSGMVLALRNFIENSIISKHLKVIFTTETLAYGFNSPVAAVVFIGLSKFDELGKRFYNFDEFISMSGRAGRRGICDKGTIILMVNKILEIEAINNVFHKRSYPINSQLQIDYQLVIEMCTIKKDEFIKEFLVKTFKNFQNNTLERDIDLYDKRISVLQKLNYITVDRKLTSKGSIFASISYNPGAIIITELITSFDVFGKCYGLSAGILSLFVCPHCSDKTNAVNNNILDDFEKIITKIRNIEKEVKISKRKLLKINYCSGMFKRIELKMNNKPKKNEKPIVKINSNFDNDDDIAIFFYVVENVLKLAKRIVDHLGEGMKDHFEHMIKILHEIDRGNGFLDY